jgi:ribonucleoside-triphosphate reductase
MLKYGSEGAKQFNSLYILKPEHSEAHRNGDIHIHDMDFLTLTTTCCQIDIEKLFRHGFSTGHGHLREPQDIQSYATLACIAIQSNQNDQHGGQSIPNFDYGMASGVAKTYTKLYRQNLAKALELLADREDAAEQALRIIGTVREEHRLVPSLKNTNHYQEAEKELLNRILPDEQTGNRIQAFAEKSVKKETTEIPFRPWKPWFITSIPCTAGQAPRFLSAPSITGRIPPLKGEWWSKTCCWQRKRVWETEKPPYSPSISSK